MYRRFLLILPLAFVAACQEFKPRVLSPPEIGKLNEPMLEGTLAVATLVDERPPSERGQEAIEHAMEFAIFDTETPYWHFRPANPGNLDLEDDKYNGAHRARYTGVDSFRWFEYPWIGTEVAQRREAKEGISDYLAAVLNRRNVASRVVRLEDASIPEGIDYVLEGTLSHFVGVMTEALPPPDPRVHPGWDVLVQGQTSLELTLRESATGDLIWRGSFAVTDDLLTVDEKLNIWHPTARELTFRKFPDHFAAWAHEAMQEHAERSLIAVMREVIVDMEGVLAPTGQQVPIPDLFDFSNIPVTPPVPAEDEGDIVFPKVEIPDLGPPDGGSGDGIFPPRGADPPDGSSGGLPFPPRGGSFPPR